MSGQQNGRITTQDDVAQRAGVSRSIVSYVINNGPRKVSPETRDRVLAAIKELEYRPNKHAQMLSSTDETLAEKYIGIILAGTYMFRRPYYGSILESIHEFAYKRDLHIRFIRVFDDFSNPTLFNELIHPNEISGVILIDLAVVLNTPDDRALVEDIVRRVERVVCVEWEWPGVTSIQFDRQKAAYQATQHLIACGRSRIAYIGPDDRRVAGYRQALWENGLTFEDAVAPNFGADATSGYDYCEQFIKSGITFDAVCAGTDETGIGVLKCLNEHGLRVPEDVAVASIDNLDISAFTIPALTAVDVPKHDIGLHAIEALMSQIVEEDRTPVSITLPTQLVIRESTPKR